MRGISKAYAGVQALDRVDLNVRAGETLALVGENGAGKSTLMKVLLGLVTPDSGSIEWLGESVQFRNAGQALESGISMIHQEISLVPKLSIAENVWLGREGPYAKAGLLGHRSRERATSDLFGRIGFDLDPAALVETLSIAQMQLVEIARAVSANAKLIIMDEPTSALTPSEIELLYGTIDSLTADGVAVVFISHKLDEVFRLSTRIAVMRDGHSVGTFEAAELDLDTLVGHIAGRELSAVSRDRSNRTLGDVVLRVDDLSGDAFEGVTFEVRAGEVLGFCGLMGAGRTEIVRAIYGLDRRRAGTVDLSGSDFAPSSPRHSVRAGVGMVTEDRLRSGSIYSYSVLQNSTLAVVASFRRLAFLNSRAELSAYKSVAARIGIKAASPSTPIGQLSGGNQQKVLLSRWLYRSPRVLILDEPTRGIDVGAKAEIYELIDRMAESGMAVIMVSSELPELLAVSDRIAVVRHGRIVHEQDAATATQEELLAHAFGVERA
jgi:ABC-type sugar transport system ATPase subunit